MTTAEELIVKLKPEGVDETVGGLEDAQDSFEETAETAGEETRELEQFSQRFKGALQVATTGLAIAAGGLLSTVPVVGESVSALGAIIQSLGLRIDQTLRPVLGVINAELFKLANRLAETRGPMGEVANVILTVVTAAGALLGALSGIIFGLNTVLGTSITLSGVLGTVAGGITTVAAAIAGVIGGISLLAGALAAAVIAVAAFAAAYLTNFMGVRDTTNAIIGSIVRIWRQGIDTIVQVFKTGFNSILAFADFAFDSLIANSKLLGNEVIRIFTGWANTARDQVIKAMNQILQKIEETVNNAITALNALPKFDLPSISIGRIESPGDITAPTPFNPRTPGELNRELRGKLQTQGRNARQSVQQLAQAIGNELDGALPDEIRAILQADGRNLAEVTDQFSGSSVANRGR